ncbi:hypothetical protein [Acidovorax sp. BLS4]|uniref:hypothetical protein n=1 Tax=Acidovorax sp. BLS4 TaxID=3273430 RepID=UPI002942B93B|nr:hypothetical protein [Paracidovorax avenae]WOI47685.1 hypothetical protein R1Z03_10930 [Paracidovorax avenae]
MRHRKPIFILSATTTTTSSMEGGSVDSIWQVVLTSSVVSAGLSTGIGLISKLFVEQRQRRATAQMIARELEAYAKKCATEIRRTDAAVEYAIRSHDIEPIDSLELPEAKLILIGLDQLKPTWRDRIASFPAKVAEKSESLRAQWRHEDSMDYADLLKEAEAELGQDAFNLALDVRTAHKLPVELARRECQAALARFAAVTEETKQRESRNSELNAALRKTVPAL